MLYIDNNGRIFTKQEVEALSLSEIKFMGIHRYEEDQEKQLFTLKDEMIGIN